MDIGRRHPGSHVKGGVVINNAEASVVKAVLANIGRKIIQGNLVDIMKISRPACISAPLTYLQCLSMDFMYCEYLKQAAAADEPLERLKYTTAFLISGMHIGVTSCGGQGPLNPILGETLHAKKEDGTVFYAEQTCHHPPVSSWEMFGPGYYFSGHGKTVAGINGPNSLHASRKGINQVVFDDGSIMTFENPDMQIDGLLVGDRVASFIGTFIVDYETHDMYAEVTINPKPKKFLGMFGGKSKLPSDHLVVNFYERNGKKPKLLSSGKGSWLEDLEFDGDGEVWNIFEPQDEWEYLPNLPSDSSYRPDLKMLEEKNIEEAQVQKDKIENLQRADKALREKSR